MNRLKRVVCLSWLCLIGCFVSAYSQPGADNKTFQQRRQQWLNGATPAEIIAKEADNGDEDKSNHLKNRLDYLSQWLENGDRGEIVDETLDFLLRFEVGQRVQWGLRSFYLIKYGSRYGNGSLSENFENKLQAHLHEWITRAKYFLASLQPNKQMWAMVSMNLYASAFEPSITLPQFGCRGVSGNCDWLAPEANNKKNWASFRYNDHVYPFGSGPVNAREFSRDYLMHKIDSWLVGKMPAARPGGPREFHSITYSRAFITSLVLLAEGLRMAGVDKELQDRALMTAELVLLEHALNFTGNALGGNLGRTDFKSLQSTFKFPLYAYFGMGKRVTRLGVEDVFLSGWKPNPVTTDVAVIADEKDDYWEVHLEYLDDNLQHDTGTGKYTYRTKHFSLGSGTRWQAVVKGDNEQSFLRFWINGTEEEPGAEQETRFMGEGARQFRNALFCKTRAEPFYHEVFSGGAASQWDAQIPDAGWDFKKQGKVMVAIRKGSGVASVEIGLEGVDGAWGEFRERVKTHASLTPDGYRTSRGVFIGKNHQYGIEQPGDLEFPFPRMKVVNSKKKVLVEYQNDHKLVIEKGGDSHTLDFGRWRSPEDMIFVDTTPKNRRDRREEPPDRVITKPQNLRVVEVRN